ncbi:MAG TPA: isovaleryl-CoA dehydrogenase [Blastocatellia bacterium]|nr:isovaleryl-CoA dehydrogenase [Blastocatellia bacterium]
MDASEFTAIGSDEILNQPPALENTNLFATDVVLREALEREGGGWIAGRAHEFGEVLGRSETLKLGVLANRFAPELRTHDRFGHRIDEVEFHPAWHELMRLGLAQEVHALPWTSDRAGAHVARAALMFLRHQVDEGTSCPLTMTFAAIPSLRLQPDIAAEWEPRVLSTEYDPRSIPADGKRGALIGMAMTERQGGSDVRANTTRARPVAARGPGEAYTIDGHKWFCSAPMSDAFLILAQAEGGLSCFLLPRWQPDGTRNGLHIQRLKDKLGNRSNASSEVEFHGAWARLVGDEGRGVAAIMEMVRHTRLDCAIGSASTVRRAVAEATHHAAHRSAFGRRLIEQPLMQNVLADLCVESEAATALAMRLARSFDEALGDERQRRFSRIATAIGKYWVTKRAVAVVAEALEVLGGNGYVEEAPLARLYRDVPLNSIWEGSGNLQCLDVLRAMRREPETVDALFEELRLARGLDGRLDRFVSRIESGLARDAEIESQARRVVEDLALALEGALLVRAGNSAVAEGFCASRLSPDRSFALGTLPSGTDFNAIIERNRPQMNGNEGR